MKTKGRKRSSNIVDLRRATPAAVMGHVVDSYSKRLQRGASKVFSEITGQKPKVIKLKGKVRRNRQK